MDGFLDLLIKKSDINNNKYFNYRHKNKINNTVKIDYKTINEPIATDYVVFDLETTGMSKENNEIIEIGAVKVKNNSIVGTANLLIKPSIPITNYISNITHITNDMVIDKPSIDKVLPKFIDFVQELPLVAHNARFDINFIKYNAMKLGLNIDNPVIDTLKLSRKYNNECKKHSLAYLTAYFNITLDNAHRAYFDAMATYELYKIIQNKYKNL